MGGIDLDFHTWPPWLLIILIAANLFKEQIGALLGSFIPTAVKDFFQFRAHRAANREEHVQLLEETLLNGQLQNEAVEQLRKSWREEQWAELVLRKDAWQQETLDRRLEALEVGQNRLIEVMIEVRDNSSSTNKILATIHVALTRLLNQRGLNLPNDH